MSKKPRDYSYDKAYAARPEQKKNRAARNKARRQLMREGKVKVGDGMDVDHRNGVPTDNRRSNWKVMSASKNRSKK